MTDVDLSEYDQFDEIKLIRDNHERIYGTTTSPSTLLDTLSSNSGSNSESQTNQYDEANCENDFVFLPPPPPPQQQSPPTKFQQHQPISQPANQQQLMRSQTPTTATTAIRTNSIAESAIKQASCQPLIAINNNTKNPFCQQVPAQVQESIGLRPFKQNVGLIVPQPAMTTATTIPSPGVTVGRIIDNYATHAKPIGLLEVSSTLNAANPNKLADLMQQIVTRADMIYIAIPCAYCHETIPCPPPDISAWLNHMSSFHNCKTCPICHKLVGLGPNKDIDIMRKHVNSCLNNGWLERRAEKKSVTEGLQHRWFSGSRCSIKEIRYR